MRYFPPILLFFLVSAGPLQGRVEMPAWDGANEAAEYHLGGGLWPRSLVPSASAAGEDPGTIAEAATPDAEGTEPGPVQFYGPLGAGEEGGIAGNTRPRLVENPDGTFVVPEEIVEEEAYEPLPPLEGDLVDLYFAHAPVDFLIDPQRLLTEQKSNDIKRFLEFHADESTFRIFVMAVGETQKIPSDIDLQQLHQQWFSDSPTVLMLYFREQPQLTELVFNDSVRDSLPKSVFDRILQNCLREGGVTELAPDQVEKMAIELSIQLYWLSRLMEHENKDDQEKAAASSIHEMTASPNAPELLREYAPGIFIDDTSKVVSLFVTLVVVVGFLAAAAFVGWLALLWRGREHVRGQPVLFPDLRVSRRLGGEFSGGGFVSISFDLNEGST